MGQQQHQQQQQRVVSVSLLVSSALRYLLLWPDYSYSAAPHCCSSFVLTPSFPVRRRQRQSRQRRRRLDSFSARFYDLEEEEEDPFYNTIDSRYDQRKGRNNNNNNNDNITEFSSALCIIPPNWDRLQRARHFARDSLFHTWPPAIRLFHPFSSETIGALDVAQAVEELELEPFEITLDTWVIVPHFEAIQAEWQTAASIPRVEDHVHIGRETEEPPEDRDARELIEREEALALESWQKRKMRRNKKTKANTKTNNTNTNSNTNSDGTHDENDGYEAASSKSTPSPATVFRSQQQQYEDSGGPCILCLEPDEESKQKLLDFRNALAEFFDLPTYFSPSSAYYPWTRLRYDELYDMGYRPLIPIASFESLPSAMTVARRLKGLWGDPLTFLVEDLHLISCRDDDDEEKEVADPTIERMMEWRSVPWGCNAKIMLMGQEMEQDETWNDDMVRKLVEEGSPGGMDISEDFTILEDEDDSVSELEMWLDDDEDFDEGTQLVIGRTHLYTGDQRAYTEMPVSSVVDHKDRSLGEQGMVSGSARRRRTSTRKKNSFEDGEYGRRDIDYLPWNKHERSHRTINLANVDKEGFSGAGADVASNDEI
jgi:hypothetical protein